MISLLLAVSVAASPRPTATATSGVTPKLKAHLESEAFVPIRHVAELPVFVRDVLTALFKDSELAMANPHEEFQVSDVISKPGLPFRRLMVAGASADHCLIAYERGGYTHSFHLVVVGMSTDKAWLEAGGLLIRPIESLDDLRTVVIAGAIQRAEKYW